LKISAKKTAQYLAELALDKKANDVVILDMRKYSGFCDYFVIAGAESTRKARAISDWVTQEAKKNGIRASHIEGEAESLWILIDFVDVVVHVFQDQTRKFYNLERLWGDASKMP
jgi:ribosome-associated protein